jgi:nitronate monooxygenase
MLAGVGYVLMGAGIPLHIPGVLDALAAHHAGRVQAEVTGAAQGPGHADALRSGRLREGPLPLLHRPRFLAIVSSNTLATTMLRRATGRVDGFVIEAPRRAGTMRRRAASCSSTPPASRSTASATR